MAEPVQPLLPPTHNERVLPPTRGESPVTRNELPLTGHEPVPPPSAAVLPPELRDRLTEVIGLPQSGQSQPLRALDGGRPVFVKLYFQGSPPEQGLLDLLRDADPRRVTQVIDFGTFRDPLNGSTRWWEMQPYHPGGTLADLLARGPGISRDRLATMVLTELTAALDYCHSDLDHAHRDIKPANILLRETAPLELVLADFGSARRQTLSNDFSSVRMTEMYAAPEALNGHLGKPQDWWSLGMVLLEILRGSHPYAGLASMSVRDRLTSHEVPLDDVEDPGWRHLLGGLLTRSREHRWTAEHIAQWRAGEQQAVVRGSSDAGATRRSIDVDGQAVRDPAELATLFVNSPAHAVDWLARERAHLADWLESDVADTGWSTRPLRSPSWDGPAARRQMASFVAHYRPDISPPRFEERAVDVAGLVALAAAAAAAGPSSTHGRIVAEIIDSRLLGIFARHHCPGAHIASCGDQGCDRLREIARSPHLPTVRDNVTGMLGAYSSARSAIPGAPDRSEVAHQAEARVLGYLLDPARAAQDRAELVRGRQPDVSWWRSWYDQAARATGPVNGMVPLALAHITLDLAQQQQRADQVRAKHEAKQARDRRRTTARSQRRGRLLVLDRRLTRWSAPVLVGAAVLALLEVLRLLQPDVHLTLYTQFLSDPTFFLTQFYFYWYDEANRWLWAPPLAEWTLPLRARSDDWVRNLVLAVGAAAVLAMFLTRRLRRTPSTGLRAVFLAVVGCSAALVFVLLPEVAAVVGAVALGGAGIALGIAVAVVVLLAMVSS